jgi:hypothetical protein
LCINYRCLNEVIQKDAYPLPRVDATLGELKDANFNTQKLASEFWQFRVTEEDVYKAEFQASHGLM